MKCPRCGCNSVVLATEPSTHQTLAHRRECEQGHRFITVEAVRPPNNQSVAFRAFMNGLRAAAQVLKGTTT